MSMHGPGPRAADPTKRAKDFRGTFLRLGRTLRPQRFRLALVTVLSALAVFLGVLGPKVLGDATNIIFAGVVGRMVPAEVTREQAIAALRAGGQNDLADMMSAVDFIPGEGIDMAALTETVVVVLGLYLAAAIASWIAARILTRVVQDVGFHFRGIVQEKIDRLPLSYLSGHARGDLLSRVTNDIDNVTQTLQQTLSQMVTAILTVVGVLGMMLWLSWQLALIALVVVPVSGFVTVTIAKRAQPNFIRQWKATGDVGGVVEEAFTGHEVIEIGRAHV